MAVKTPENPENSDDTKNVFPGMAGFVSPARKRGQTQLPPPDADFLKILGWYYQTDPAKFRPENIPVLAQFTLSSPPDPKRKAPLVAVPTFGKWRQPVSISQDSVLTQSNGLDLEGALKLAMLALENPALKGGVELVGDAKAQELLAYAAAAVGLVVLNGPQVDPAEVEKIRTQFLGPMREDARNTPPPAPSSPGGDPHDHDLSLNSPVDPAAAGSALAAAPLLDGRTAPAAPGPAQDAELAAVSGEKLEGEIRDRFEKAIQKLKDAGQHQKGVAETMAQLEKNWPFATPEIRLATLKKYEGRAAALDNPQAAPAPQAADPADAQPLSPEVKKILDNAGVSEQDYRLFRKEVLKDDVFVPSSSIDLYPKAGIDIPSPEQDLAIEKALVADGVLSPAREVDLFDPKNPPKKPDAESVERLARANVTEEMFANAVQAVLDGKNPYAGLDETQKGALRQEFRDLNFIQEEGYRVIHDTKKLLRDFLARAGIDEKTYDAIREAALKKDLIVDMNALCREAGITQPLDERQHLAIMTNLQGDGVIGMPDSKVDLAEIPQVLNKGTRDRLAAAGVTEEMFRDVAGKLAAEEPVSAMDEAQFKAIIGELNMLGAYTFSGFPVIAGKTPAPAPAPAAAAPPPVTNSLEEDARLLTEYWNQNKFAESFPSDEEVIAVRASHPDGDLKEWREVILKARAEKEAALEAAKKELIGYLDAMDLPHDDREVAALLGNYQESQHRKFLDDWKRRAEEYAAAKAAPPAPAAPAPESAFQGEVREKVAQFLDRAAARGEQPVTLEEYGEKYDALDEAGREAALAELDVQNAEWDRLDAEKGYATPAAAARPEDGLGAGFAAATTAAAEPSAVVAPASRNVLTDATPGDAQAILAEAGVSDELYRKVKEHVVTTRKASLDHVANKTGILKENGVDITTADARAIRKALKAEGILKLAGHNHYDILAATDGTLEVKERPAAAAPAAPRPPEGLSPLV